MIVNVNHIKMSLLYKKILTVDSSLLIDYLRSCLIRYVSNKPKLNSDLENLKTELLLNNNSFIVDLSQNLTLKSIRKTNSLLSDNSSYLIIIFLHLSRILDIDNKDEDGRQLSKDSFYYTYLKTNPYLCDEIIEILQYDIIKCKPKLVLTSDLDWPFFYSNTFKGWARKLYHFLTGKYIGDKFDKILEMSKFSNSLNTEWLFFLLPKGTDTRDSKSFELKRLNKRFSHLDHLNYSYQIGYHIPISSVSEHTEIYPQLENIRKKHLVNSVRSHYLCSSYEMDKISFLNNIQSDYSDGYTDAISSFSGFSKPYYSWNAFRENKKLLKYPTNIMDIHLKNCYDNGDDFKKDVQCLFYEAKKYNAHLTVLWHNDNFNLENDTNSLMISEIYRLWGK